MVVGNGDAVRLGDMLERQVGLVMGLFECIVIKVKLRSIKNVQIGTWGINGEVWR
ncbi:MAG: hypothetical protein PHG63_01140 [Candidatus Dojkabacteria bacterium]|nr:hypothetical protein [Candidatus Dojkabacteria bacterium]